MAGQVNTNAEPTSASDTADREKMVVCLSKCNAKLSYNDDGTPTVLDGNYVFIKDNGSSISLNCNLIDINIENQVVRVVGDDNSVEEITLDCTDPLYGLDSETNFQNADDSQNISFVGEELCEAWGDAATRLLLSLYGDLITHVKTRKIRTFKAMWEQMSELMLEQGFRFTPCQISNRFKTLKRAYLKKKFDRTHRRLQKGRMRAFLRRCPYERELEELFTRQGEVFPNTIHVLDEDTFAQAQFFSPAGIDVTDYLEDDEQLQEFADSESYATPVVEMTDHMDYVEPFPAGRTEGGRKKTRPNALEELRNLRASTLKRLTCMDVKRDAFHEEVLEELRHKNSMLEKLLELVTKEPLH